MIPFCSFIVMSQFIWFSGYINLFYFTTYEKSLALSLFFYSPFKGLIYDFPKETGFLFRIMGVLCSAVCRTFFPLIPFTKKKAETKGQSLFSW